mgnify:CR=1 FL=1
MSFLPHLFAGFRNDPGKRRLHDSETLLASAQCDQGIAFTFDIALSHAEFVRSELGTLPEGARVDTIRKVGRQLVRSIRIPSTETSLPLPPFDLENAFGELALGLARVGPEPDLKACGVRLAPIALVNREPGLGTESFSGVG